MIHPKVGAILTQSEITPYAYLSSCHTKVSKRYRVQIENVTNRRTLSIQGSVDTSYIETVYSLVS